MRYFKQILIVLCFLFSIVAINAQVTDKYAAPPPIGSSGNDGSIDSPWDLQTGLTNIMPGETLWLRGGQYDGRFNNMNNPYETSSDLPITVKSYPGEWAILNGNVDDCLSGSQCVAVIVTTKSYWTFENFEITFLGEYTRDYTDPNYRGCSGINQNIGDECRFINLIIHEVPTNGIGTWKSAGGTEIYGCLIYNVGNQIGPGTDNPDDGSGIYAQNATDLWKNFNNNIFFNNFKVGAKLYSDSFDGGGPQDFIKNLNFEDNAILNSGSPINPTRGRECFIVGSKSIVEGRARTHDINVLRNFMFHNNHSNIESHAEVFRIGQQLTGSNASFYGNYASNITVEDNYFLGRKEGVRLIRVGEDFHFKRNIVRSEYLFSVKNYVPNQNIITMTSENWHFDDNHYFTKWSNPSNQEEKFLTFGIPGGWSTNHFLSELVTPFSEGGEFEVETGESSHQEHTELNEWLDINTSKTISIVQNQFMPNRFKIVVYDIGSDDVVVDLSSYNILAGTPYIIRDAENYFGVIENPGYILGENSLIKLPMGLTAVDLPNGDYPSKTAGIIPKKTDSEFGVFIVDFDEDFCIPDLVFQNETETGTEVYEVDNSITTAGSSTYFNVNPGANITHKAGNFILLQDGTHIKHGSNYLAEIQPCSSTELEYVGESHPEYRKRITQTKEEDLKTESNKIKVSPNPATTQLEISSSEDMSSIILTNTLGKTFLEMNVTRNSSMNAELNLSGIPSGMYFLKIILTTGEVITKQIVKK